MIYYNRNTTKFHDFISVNENLLDECFSCLVVLSQLHVSFIAGVYKFLNQILILP